MNTVLNSIIDWFSEPSWTVEVRFLIAYFGLHIYGLIRNIGYFAYQSLLSNLQSKDPADKV